MWHQWATIMPRGYECLICWNSVGSQCGRPVVPASSWEWQEGRTDCDSSHCGPAPGLSLPPGSHCCFTHNKCKCHLSAYLPVPWGGRGKKRLWVGTGKQFWQFLNLFLEKSPQVVILEPVQKKAFTRMFFINQYSMYLPCGVSLAYHQ